MLIDPMRIGIAGVLMSRRHAIRTLLAFWVGGIVAGITVGICTLVLLHESALVAIRAVTSAINHVRSEVVILGGDHLKVTLGVLALACLATMLARERARVTTPVREMVSVGGGDSSEASETSVPATPPSLLSRLSNATNGMLESGFAWPAFLAGLLSTVPPIEGPMALAVIMASQSATHLQLGAFVVFILLALTFIEIPLVGYLIAPQRTEAVMLQMNAWIYGHRRQITHTLLAVTGVVLLAQGLGSL